MRQIDSSFVQKSFGYLLCKRLVVWTSVKEFRSKKLNSKLVGVSYKETNQKLSYIETNKINSITQNNLLTPSFNIFELKSLIFDFQSFFKVSNFLKMFEWTIGKLITRQGLWKMWKRGWKITERSFFNQQQLNRPVIDLGLRLLIKLETHQGILAIAVK